MSSHKDKTVQSALAILLPPSLSPPLQKIRAQYDKSHTRWPPHINLLYPFLPAVDFDYAATTLRGALSNSVEAFMLRLDTVSHFSHRHSATIFLESSEASNVKTLQAIVERVFPHCDDLSRRGEADGGSFHPHLTVGQVRAGGAQATKKIVELEAVVKRDCLESGSIEWKVDGVYLIARQGDEPFQVRARIPFIGATDEDNKLVGTKYIAEEFGNRLEGDEGAWPMRNPEPYQRRPKFWTWYERPTYIYDHNARLWVPSTNENTPPSSFLPPTNLSVVTYNVLFDPFMYPSKRHHLLSNHLSCTNADIIALQEVTITFFRHLLVQDWICNGRYIISHSLNEARDFSEKGVLVLLSRYPFRHYHLPFSSEKHLLVARVILGSVLRPLYVPVVHLTSNHYTNTNTRLKRAEQMDCAYAFLNALSSTEWDGILMGDFNADDAAEAGLIAHGFRDAWEALQDKERRDVGVNDIYADANGYTFDPTKNVLAELVSRNKDWPRRFDRVVVKGRWVPVEMTRIGVDPVVEEDGKSYLASDHYGLSCRLAYDEAAASLQQLTELTDTSIRDTITFESTEDIEALLRLHDVFETPEGDALRTRALDTLTTTLRRTMPLALVILGSYALGVHSRSSDIDCLCISSFTQERFFDAIQSVFPTSDTKSDTHIRRIVADSHIPIVKLRVFGSVDVDLQYCCAPLVIERWSELASLPPYTSFPNLRASVMTILNGWRDTTFIMRLIPDLTNFRIVYRVVRLWCERKGLYSNKFGYVGGAALTVLVARVCQTYPKSEASELVYRFFELYGKHQWESRPVALSVPSADNGVGSGYHASGRDAMCILTVNRPQVNITRNATKHTRRVWAEELRNAMDLFITDRASVALLFAETDFLTRYKSYIQITLYAPTGSTYRKLTAYFESRCVELLTKMQQRSPDLLAHAFPRRYRLGPNDDVQGYTGRYLIGLAKASATAEQAKERRERQLAEFLEVLREFEGGMRAWKGMESSMWCEVKHAPLGKIVVAELDDETSDAGDEMEVFEKHSMAANQA